MGTTYDHVQLSSVDSNGNVNVLYPINTATDVSIDVNNNAIPSSVKNLQNLVDNIGSMAFNQGEDFVYLGESTDYNGELSNSEISDNSISTITTWSSSKITTNTTAFTQGYKMTTDTVDKLFINPVVFNVDGRYTAYNEYSPEEGKQWVVEYFPIVTSANNVVGEPGGSNTVTTAMQRWTGIDYTGEATDVVVYERTYINNVWNDFVKIR